MSGSYGKLYHNNGKILLIGVGLTSNTFIHAVDETIDTEVYKTLVVTMTDYDGKTWEQTLNLTAGPGSSTFDRYTKALEEADAITYGKIGDADSMLVDARKCFEVVERIRRAEKGMN